jgi:hypothetical protein
MRLPEAEARQLAADLVAAAMPAAALAAAVTWVAAAAMAAAVVTGKFNFGSSPKSPSASADGFFVGVEEEQLVVWVSGLSPIP